MNSKNFFILLGVLSSCVGISSADVASARANMQFVPVAYNSSNPGAVNYGFQMGKYEVTADQWENFTSSASLIASPSNDKNQFDDSVWIGGTMPAVNMTWYQAAQYCNWLSSGSTSEGVYTFKPDGSLDFIDRSYRKDDVAYVLPTINEWNKAGYFNGSVFTKFANGTDTIPRQTEANYDNQRGGSPATTDPWLVGSGAVESINGTFDMMGNVWEWTEDAGGQGQLIAGGASHWTEEQWLRYRSEGHNTWYTDDGTSFLGFRVAAMYTPMSVTILPPMIIGGDMAFSFISQSGVTHSVECTTNLITGPWGSVTNFLGDGLPALLTLPATNSAAFYRVQTQ